LSLEPTRYKFISHRFKQLGTSTT